MRNAKEVQDRIRKIDAEMASLFQKRMEAARDMAAYIKERGLRVEDCQDLELPAPGESPVTDEVIGQYYLSFLQNTRDISRKYQERLVSGAIVAFCGTEGAFAHIAAKRIFPDSRFVPYSSFEDAYLSVVEGESDYAVLPIENSYAGEVGQVMDLMFREASLSTASTLSPSYMTCWLYPEPGQTRSGPSSAIPRRWISASPLSESMVSRFRQRSIQPLPPAS